MKSTWIKKIEEKSHTLYARRSENECFIEKSDHTEWGGFVFFFYWPDGFSLKVNGFENSFFIKLETGHGTQMVVHCENWRIIKMCPIKINLQNKNDEIDSLK